MILINQDTSDIPFDFGHLRVIQYSLGADGLERLKDELVGVIRQVLATEKWLPPYYKAVQVETGLSSVVRRIVREFDECKVRHKEFVSVVRFMPAEITAAMLASSSGRGTGTELADLLNRYHQQVREIISEGDDDDNWDYTIYGTTTDPDINQGTADFVRSVYFGDSPPGTSEVGFNPNLTNIGFITLGFSKGDISDFRPDTALILFQETRSARYGVCAVVKDETFCQQIVSHWFAPSAAMSEKSGFYNVVNNKTRKKLEQAANKNINAGSQASLWDGLFGS